MRPARFRSFLLLLALAAAAAIAHPAVAETWRGLQVADEHRCSPYDKKHYRYSRKVEQRIVEEYGGVYGPYTGRWFADAGRTDIEHIIARSEAHDSGLCAAPIKRRREFAGDILNLTLASPTVNRSQKSDRDAAEWMPELNRCWFADRVLRVRLRYGLTIDRREAEALEEVLSSCESTRLVVYRSPPDEVGADATSKARERMRSLGADHPLALWDDNGNRRITCKEARNHGIAPVHRDHPAYRFMNDGDEDGVVCE